MKPIHLLTDDELALRLREAVALPDAPATLIRKVIAQWPSAHGATMIATAKAALRSMVAALTFDSWSAGSLAYGVRGVPSDVRHLLYSALGRDVDVRIMPSANDFVLAGQVLGPDDSGMIELTRASNDADGGAQAVKVASLDAMGQFRIEGVPRGEYVLRFRLGEDEIVLPAIDLSERRD